MVVPGNHHRGESYGYGETDKASPDDEPLISDSYTFVGWSRKMWMSVGGCVKAPIYIYRYRYPYKSYTYKPIIPITKSGFVTLPVFPWHNDVYEHEFIQYVRYAHLSLIT